MPNDYYEAHIVRKDGTTWEGHTGSTPEEAEQQARKQQDLVADVIPVTPSHIRVYHCILVRSHSW